MVPSRPLAYFLASILVSVSYLSVADPLPPAPKPGDQVVEIDFLDPSARILLNVVLLFRVGEEVTLV